MSHETFLKPVTQTTAGEKVEIDEDKADMDNDDFDDIQEYLFNLRSCFKTVNKEGIELVTFMH